MNQRIKELAEQAENYAHEQNDKFGLSYKREYDKKFAELIVRECADYIQHFYGDIAASSIGNDIKLHFGIEE